MALNRSHPAARPRVLFVAESVTLAHVARPFILASSLCGLPYDVHFAWHPRYEAMFPHRPFVEHTIESITNEQFMRSLAKGKPIYDARTLDGYVKADMRLLDEVTPDVVIGDTRLSLSVSARKRRVPYIALANAYWSPHARTSYPVPQHPLTRLLGVRAAQWLFDRIRPIAFAQHARPMNAVRRKHGLPAIAGDVRSVYTDADQTWYVDVPGQTMTDDLPANHHDLGPLPWSPQVPLPAWWDRLPRRKPVVYVCLGSSGRHDLLPAILRGLATLPVTVIAATAGQRVPANTPANAFVAPYLPGDIANQRAALTIGNGGSPITQQALAHATPVLGIPSILDQHLNMQGVVACNAGRTLRSEHVTAERITELVTAMLDDEALTQGAARFADEIRRFPAVERFKTLLGKILATRRRRLAA